MSVTAAVGTARERPAGRTPDALLVLGATRPKPLRLRATRTFVGSSASTTGTATWEPAHV